MLTEVQFNDLVLKLGSEAAKQIQEKFEAAEKSIQQKQLELTKDSISLKDFNAFKETQMQIVNDALKRSEKAEEVAKQQGMEILALKERGGNPKKLITLEQFFEEQKDNITKAKQNGSYIEFTGAQLKAAGIIGVSSGFGTIEAQSNVPTSPYLPGIGEALELFDLIYDPNFITTRVDLGRTNQRRLAWINETGQEGTPSIVSEGAPKPMLDIAFKVEMSEAKKVAGYVKITEEFEEDLPGLATAVRRMVQQRVLRYWDDLVQNAVLLAARPFNITGMNGDIQDANFWDAVYAMMTQVRTYHFEPNTVGLNPVTDAKMKMLKATDGTYLTPTFAADIERLRVLANKVAINGALVGDLKQFNVDIYKDFVLKVGWINDDLIRNQFVVLGEMRYHDYISDNRRNAICYSDLPLIISQIDGTPGS